MKIYIVIVTYNRINCLKNTIEAALQQQAEIIVVNNNSTDGTTYYLNSIENLYESLNIFNLSENTGGSGGFAFGINKAVEMGADWIWVMDDDVVAVDNSIKKMLPYTKIAQCIYPAKEYADGSLYDFEAYVSRSTLKRTRISKIKKLNETDFIDVNGGCFEGAFFSSQVVKKIGLPDARFFICWDDILWGMKAAEYFKCIYINDVCIKKQFDKERLTLLNKRLYASTVFSRYHFFRNYWSAIYYLKGLKELSWSAYARYLYEFTKAIGITLIIERDIKGVYKILLGCLYGIQQKYVDFNTL